MTVGEPVQVRVDWAVWSKRPGGAMGYTVLAYSTDPTHALHLIKSGTTGTATDENLGNNDALPWVSFIADRTQSSAKLGVVERTWSDERDATGQPIVPSRLLVVGWPASKAALPGFVRLWELAQTVSWTGVDGAPEEVHGPYPIARKPAPLSVDLLVKVIEDLGFEWTLSAAVALLDGDQVALVTPGRVFALRQRVQMLDAICALLPYGCRAWISASTWAQDRSAHPVNLSFADRGRSGQRVINFEKYDPATPRTVDAADYLAEMKLLRSEGVPTAKIVEHLVEQYEPLGPKDGALAVKHLKELRLVAATVEDIKNCKGDPERVDEVLTRFGWRGLTPDTRTVLAEFLVDTAAAGRSKPGQAACALLRRHWGLELLQCVVDMIVDDLCGGRDERARTRMATLAGLAPTVRNEVVAAVLQRVAAAPVVDAAVAERTVDLLVRTKSLILQNVAAWAVLARCPELGARLVQAMSDLRTRGKGAHFHKMLSALVPHQNSAEARWVGVVWSLYNAGQVDPDIESFPAPVLQVAYDVAYSRKLLRRFFAVAWSYTLKVAYLRDNHGRHPNLGDIAARVADGTTVLAPPAAAALQLLILGNERVPRLNVSLCQDLPSLAAAWCALPPEGRATLGPRLSRAILGKTMTPESFRALVAVTDALDPVDQRHPGTYGLWDHATAEVGERLSRQPDLLPQLSLDEQWANDLVQYVPQYAWLTQWFAVHTVAQVPETEPVRIREAYSDLRKADAPVGAAVRAIVPWLWARGASGLDELIGSFGPPLGNGPWPAEEIRHAVFAAPDLQALGFDLQRLAVERLRRSQEAQQYYLYQVGANDAVMKDEKVQTPLDLEAVSPPPAAPQPGSTGPWNLLKPWRWGGSR